MNVENLRDNYPKLISYLETNGYSKIYVDRFKREIKKILAAAGSKEWSCYRDVYLEYTKTSKSPGYLREKRTIIGAIEQFDVFGRYPDGRRRHKLFKRGAYPLLSEEFKSIIDYYCEEEKKRGKKASTIYTESGNATYFDKMFYYCAKQDNNVAASLLLAEYATKQKWPDKPKEGHYDYRYYGGSIKLKPASYGTY